MLREGSDLPKMTKVTSNLHLNNEDGMEEGHHMEVCREGAVVARE